MIKISPSKRKQKCGEYDEEFSTYQKSQNSHQLTFTSDHHLRLTSSVSAYFIGINFRG